MSGLDKVRNVSSEPAITPTALSEEVFAQTVTARNLVVEESITFPDSYVATSSILRWSKVVSGGETVISGVDSNGKSLLYNPGYEQVYLNGILLLPGVDYVATNGTIITVSSPLAVSDVFEVVAPSGFSSNDSYTQAQTDALFYNKGLSDARYYTQTQANARYFTKQTSSTSSGEASTVNINTKPWNMPWGLQYHNATITNTVTSNTVAALTTSFTFVNNRRYKVSAAVCGLNASGRVLGAIAVGTLGGNRFYDFTVAGYFNPHGYTIVTGTGTSQSITVGFSVISGSSSLAADNLAQNSHTLTIEDVGPA